MRSLGAMKTLARSKDPERLARPAAPKVGLVNEMGASRSCPFGQHSIRSNHTIRKIESGFSPTETPTSNVRRLGDIYASAKHMCTRR